MLRAQPGMGPPPSTPQAPLNPAPLETLASGCGKQVFRDGRTRRRVCDPMRRAWPHRGTHVAWGREVTGILWGPAAEAREPWRWGCGPMDRRG